MGYLSQRWYHPMKEKSTVCPYACAAKKGKTKSRCIMQRLACLFV
jgi:hypothetical protein